MAMAVWFDLGYSEQQAQEWLDAAEAALEAHERAHVDCEGAPHPQGGEFCQVIVELARPIALVREALAVAICTCPAHVDLAPIFQLALGHAVCGVEPRDLIKGR